MMIWVVVLWWIRRIDTIDEAETQIHAGSFMANMTHEPLGFGLLGL